MKEIFENCSSVFTAAGILVLIPILVNPIFAFVAAPSLLFSCISVVLYFVRRQKTTEIWYLVAVISVDTGLLMFFYKVALALGSA